VLQAVETDESAQLVYKFSNTRASSIRTIMIARRNTSTDTSQSVTRHSAGDSRYGNLSCGDADTEQLLIFTKGSRTYTPHQIGIKRMPRLVDALLAEQNVHNRDIETQDFGQNEEDAADDNVDESIELHGHIIGMNLSPDHRLACLSCSMDISLA